jgi:hypothetical protein
VVVHLCVDHRQRRRGAARALVDTLVRDVAGLSAIRLSCREDYGAANALWARLGFVREAERPGRGADGKRLYTWRRQVSPQPSLFDRLNESRIAGRRKVAIDANVFFDLHETTDRAEESRALLADWVDAEVALCITAELHNEIGRSGDAFRREQSRRRCADFIEIRALPAALKSALETVDAILPAPVGVQDESDRRQLSHAIADGAWAFVTHDAALLEHADAVRSAAGIQVIRPLDLILQLHAGAEPLAYEPARLVGTRVTSAAPNSTEWGQIEARFLRCDEGESRGAWIARLRPVLSDPRRYTARTLRLPDSPPLVLFAQDRGSAGVLGLPVLRALSHPLTSTLLRRVLAEQLTVARDETRQLVTCEDGAPGLVDAALADLDFQRVGKAWLRAVVPGVVQADGLAKHILGVPAEASVGLVRRPRTAEDVHAVERRLWPLKVAGLRVPCFAIPIQPHWAMELFDTRLAEARLFGATAPVALALENVYYSASRVSIPAGSRILWYVSQQGSQVVMEIRASSICGETAVGPATELFRKFRRLGVFRWDDVRAAAKGNAHGELRAYRFSHTERFRFPVTWGEVQQILLARTGHPNPIAGPTPIDERAFFDIYERGFSRDAG